MKKLPWIFALTHAVLALMAFGVTMPPLHWDIFPIILAMVDIPASWLAAWLSDLVNGSIVFDCMIYIVFGSAWFYFIGFLLRTIIEKLKPRMAAK
jgi:hypothetical protein